MNNSKQRNRRYRMSVVAISILILMMTTWVDSTTLYTQEHDDDRNTGEYSPYGIEPINQNGPYADSSAPYVQSNIDNQSGIPSIATSKAYVGGDMIDLHEEINYTTVDVGFWGLRDSKVGEAIGQLDGFSVVHADSFQSFTTQLELWSAAVMTDFSYSTLFPEENAQLSIQIRNWVSQGNLLIIDDTDLIIQTFYDDFNIINVTTKGEGVLNLVSFVPATPLTHLLTGAQLSVEGPISVFSLPSDTNLVVIANYEDPETNETLPVVVMAAVGNGFCLFSGLDLSPNKEYPNVDLLYYMVIDALKTYSEVDYSLYTRPFSILDPISPHLQPLDASNPIQRDIDSVARKLRRKGFNVFYSNLLYSDYEGSYYGKLSIRAPLEAFVQAFSSSVIFGYDASPNVQLTSVSGVYSFTSGLFVRAPVVSNIDLFWPPDWNPPDVSYYHLSPNKLAAHDMGSDLWSPRSVEEVIRADDARNFGLSGSGVKVAIIDTGFSHDRTGLDYPGDFHPFYEEYYSDMLENRFTGHNVSELDWRDDSDGHGTGMVSNLLSVAPEIYLHFFKLPPLPDIAFDAALQVNPDIISCSWGYRNGDPSRNPTLLNLIRQAVENGIIVVFPSGNAGQPGWPGNDPSVVSVGGVYVDFAGNLQASSYADSGIKNGRIFPDVCGVVGQSPHGVLIEMPTEPESYSDIDFSVNASDGTTIDDGWWVASGTSSAAPQVAGLAALIKQQEPGINQGRFKHLIMTTSTDVITGNSADGYSAGPGFDLATGAGLIDCYRAVKTMVQRTPSNIYEPMTFPQGKHVNFYSFSGPHGASYHIDTSGSYEYGYTFLGYLASRDGAFMTRQDGIRVTGWFRQYDTFPTSLRPGRRYLNLYVMSVDGQQILHTTKILDENSGTGWVLVDVTITGLPDFGMVRIAVGRGDGWFYDWQLTGEWADVNVYSFDDWQGITIPDGKQVNFGPSLAPDAHMGTTYRVDTIGTSQYSFYFDGESDFYPYLTPYASISVAGWFRLDDTFNTETLRKGRRYLDIYLVRPSDYAVLANYRILDWYDGTDWVHRRIKFTVPFVVGVHLFVIGRYDAWSHDWGLTGEWCNVQITLGLAY